MDGLLAGYRSPAYDEMVDARGRAVPAHASRCTRRCSCCPQPDLTERGAARARSFLEQGITFSSSGREWVFPLDLIPRLIPAQEWEHIEAGVVQRVRALEAFLADVYGERQVLADGVVPHSLIATSVNFVRAAAGIRPPNGVRIHLAGIDLVRDSDGVMRVLEDNLRVPSGISYVVENREALTRVFPGLFLEQQVQPVATYVATMLDSLRAAAPRGVSDPTVVLLTPGRAQLGLLRARVPGPQDGHRAGRGPGPVLPRQRALHAHDRRAAAGGRGLPAHRRRLPRPAAVPAATR